MRVRKQRLDSGKVQHHRDLRFRAVIQQRASDDQPPAGTARPKASPTARAKSGTGNPR